MKNLIFSFLLCLFTCGIVAQEKFLNDTIETQALSQAVAEHFANHKISKAFRELIPYWPLPMNEIEVMEEKTIKYLNVIEERFGKSIGFVKIKNETIADIAIRETYLIRYEYTAIRLIFTYYKGNNGWLVNAFKWDDSFTEEFK